MSHSNKYHFIIEPYELNDEDKALISQGTIQSLLWDNDHYKPFKNRIREHLRKKQLSRCGFCRLRLNNSQFYPHLEHLVSKTDYKQFAFLPNNLVWCCQICNFSKGRKNTLHNPNTDFSLQVYPIDSNGFIIINPYYDNVLEHIEFLGEVIVKPKNNSTKGKNTINFYKLERLKLAEDRAAEANIDKADLEDYLLQRLVVEDDPNIITVINNLINKLPDIII
jgi:uncharacterized protein (TIGR02646 family)